jgi:hypothetical protein
MQAEERYKARQFHLRLSGSDGTQQEGGSYNFMIVPHLQHL